MFYIFLSLKVFSPFFGPERPVLRGDDLRQPGAHAQVSWRDFLHAARMSNLGLFLHSSGHSGASADHLIHTGSKLCT